jgi:hypothetical protein
LPKTPVYLELGAKRVFACALDWPGWCRSGKTEDDALATLAAAAPRYADVARDAGLSFPDMEVGDFAVVERLPGSATTDFGVPEKAAEADARPLDPKEAERLAKLVAASWTVLDRVVAAAPPSLRKGPRGGGRDRDAVFAHVEGAENGYSRKIGVRMPEVKPENTEALAALRAGILAVIKSGVEPETQGKPWLLRYAARRIAWHALDHAWEIEDRSEQ